MMIDGPSTGGNTPWANAPILDPYSENDNS